MRNASSVEVFVLFISSNVYEVSTKLTVDAMHILYIKVCMFCNIAHMIVIFFLIKVNFVNYFSFASNESL